MPVIKCPGCGSMISTKAAACPKCGHAVGGAMQNNGGTNQTYNPPQQTGSQGYPPQQPVQQNYPLQQPYYPPVQPQQEDKAKVGLCILSFLIPLVGWILYFANRNDYPVKAKACSTWAWVGFVLNIILLFSGVV